MGERGRSRGASTHEDAGRGGPDGAPPQDRLLDRRLFLERMGLLTAAAAAGTAFTPAGGGVYPAGTVPWGGAVAWPLPDHRSVQATQPWEMTLAELAAQIRAGALSPTELVEAYLTH